MDSNQVVKVRRNPNHYYQDASYKVNISGHSLFIFNVIEYNMYSLHLKIYRNKHGGAIIRTVASQVLGCMVCL